MEEDYNTLTTIPELGYSLVGYNMQASFMFFPQEPMSDIDWIMFDMFHKLYLN